MGKYDMCLSESTNWDLVRSMDDHNKNLTRFTNWDLVSSFVTAIWECRMSVPEHRRPDYDRYYVLMNRLRYELLKRLEEKGD